MTDEEIKDFIHIIRDQHKEHISSIERYASLYTEKTTEFTTKLEIIGEQIKENQDLLKKISQNIGIIGWQRFLKYLPAAASILFIIILFICFFNIYPSLSNFELEWGDLKFNTQIKNDSH